MVFKRCITIYGTHDPLSIPFPLCYITISVGYCSRTTWSVHGQNMTNDIQSTNLNWKGTGRVWICTSVEYMSHHVHVQWKPSKADTIGTKNFVCCSEVSLAQGLVVDHAPPTIAASYDEARATVDDEKDHIDERSVN